MKEFYLQLSCNIFLAAVFINFFSVQGIRQSIVYSLVSNIISWSWRWQSVKAILNPRQGDTNIWTECPVCCISLVARYAIIIPYYIDMLFLIHIHVSCSVRIYAKFLRIYADIFYRTQKIEVTRVTGTHSSHFERHVSWHYQQPIRSRLSNVVRHDTPRQIMCCLSARFGMFVLSLLARGRFFVPWSFQAQQPKLSIFASMYILVQLWRRHQPRKKETSCLSGTRSLIG